MKKPGVVLAAICAAMLFQGAQIGGIQTLLAGIGREFGLDVSQTGQLASLQYICVIAAPLTVSGLADRFGKGRAVKAAMLVYLAGCVIASSALSAEALVVGLLLVGGGYGVLMAVSCAWLEQLYPGKGSRCQSLTQCAFGLAAFLSPLCIRTVHLSWRGLFQAVAAGMLLCLLPLCLYRDVPPEASLCEAIRTGKGDLALLMLCMVMGVGLESGVTYFAVSLFLERAWQETWGAYALSAFWLAVMAGRFLFSRLSVRVLKAVGLLECAVTALLAGVYFSEGPKTTVLLFALLGLAVSAVGPMLVGEAAASYRAASGRAAGLVVSASGVGSVLALVLMGWIGKRMSVSQAYLLLAVLAAAGAAVALLGAKQKKREEVLRL